MIEPIKVDNNPLSSEVDVFIIGAGPIGLACAIEARKADLSYLVVDKGCLVNSLYHYPVNMTFFSTSERLEIGGVPFMSLNPKPNRAEAVEYYRRVVEKYNLQPRLFEPVEKVMKPADWQSGESSNYKITTSKGSYTARNIIIA